MNFTAFVHYADGRTERNATRTLKHAELYLAFAANPIVTSVEITNRTGDVVASATS